MQENQRIRRRVKGMSKKWEFLYLSQEDCVAAGGTDMTGAMKAVERSFFLHGKGDFKIGRAHV